MLIENPAICMNAYSSATVITIGTTLARPYRIDRMNAAAMRKHRTTAIGSEICRARDTASRLSWRTIGPPVSCTTASGSSTRRSVRRRSMTGTSVSGASTTDS